MLLKTELHVHGVLTTDMQLTGWQHGSTPTPFIQKIQIQLLNCLESFYTRIFYTGIFRLVD